MTPCSATSEKASGAHGLGRMARWSAFSALIAVLPLLWCTNPFFPATGEPHLDARLRRTPDGVITQLVNAYQQRQLWLFKDLLAPPEKFRSYIASSVVSNLEHLRSVTSTEIIDSVYPFIVTGTEYSYISYDTEIRIHRQLFTNATSIVFLEPLTTEVEYVVEPVHRVGDQGRDTVVYDTVAAGVLTQNSQMRITSDRLIQAMGGQTQAFELGRQVFYLERDPLDPALWVIVKWFEL